MLASWLVASLAASPADGLVSWLIGWPLGMQGIDRFSCEIKQTPDITSDLNPNPNANPNLKARVKMLDRIMHPLSLTNVQVAILDVLESELKLNIENKTWGV